MERCETTCPENFALLKTGAQALFTAIPVHKKWTAVPAAPTAWLKDPPAKWRKRETRGGGAGERSRKRRCK